MKTKDLSMTKKTCYYSYLATASVFSLPPLLFVTFKELYGITYTLLGTLVLINFFTQLTIDLMFTFLSKHFNIRKTTITMPIITSVGLLIYALIPTFFPEYAYIGLLIGTVIFSVSAGLNEVLISPLVAACPSDNPDRDMSRLHSLYAYGVLSVIVISTLFLRFAGKENWMYLTLFFALLPIAASVMFGMSPIPDIQNTAEQTEGKTKNKAMILFLCAACIFFGSISENVMTNWISTYAEMVLGIPKVAGDLFGMATFAVLLGLTRTAYAKYGRNIWFVLTVGMGGAAVCYFTASVASNFILALGACVMCGICTSMLWPGTLILMEEKLPGAGVAAYALMAAAGDFGAALGPQSLGIVIDKVALTSFAADLSNKTAMATEQIGMRVGMMAAVLFPLAGLVVLFVIRKKLGSSKQTA